MPLGRIALLGRNGLTSDAGHGQSPKLVLLGRDQVSDFVMQVGGAHRTACFKRRLGKDSKKKNSRNIFTASSRTAPTDIPLSARSAQERAPQTHGTGQRGSIGRTDLVPDAMPDAVLIVPVAGTSRIVAQGAEVETLEPLSAVLGGLRYPGRTGHDRDRIADRIIARTALRTATYERRRLEQHIRNGSGPMREPAANGAKRKPDANPHAVGTDSLDSNSVSESESRTVPSNDS